MTKTEERFQARLKANYEAAVEYGCNPTRFFRELERRSGADIVREQLRRRRTSDGFEALHRAGHLELSVEAAVVEKEFASLFTDEEVDACLEILLECGFFGYR